MAERNEHDWSHLPPEYLTRGTVAIRQTPDGKRIRRTTITSTSVHDITGFAPDGSKSPVEPQHVADVYTNDHVAIHNTTVINLGKEIRELKQRVAIAKQPIPGVDGDVQVFIDTQATRVNTEPDQISDDLKGHELFRLIEQRALEMCFDTGEDI